MHTDYIGGEERCRFIARRLIYWIAAVAVTGGAADATGLMDVVRAHANTTPLMSRTASAPAKPEAHAERRSGAFIALPAQPAPRPRKTADVTKADAVKHAVVETVKIERAPAGIATIGTSPFEPVAFEPVRTETMKVEPANTTPADTNAAEADAVPVATATAEAAPEWLDAIEPSQPETVLSSRLGEEIDESGVIESPLFNVVPTTPFALADMTAPAKPSRVDPRFEEALTALAMQHSGLVAVGPGEEIPTQPYPRKSAGSPTTVAAVVPEIAATVAAQPAGLSDVVPATVPLPIERPTVLLPSLAELPLPRPRPPLTPAQELGLHGKERAKAENCLARAIYFESRNEPVRGQIAVAQVVLNRVFSPYYPDTICDVVYQNAHRRLSCQFTFACDGIPDIVRERGPWQRAQKIAKQALDAQVWLTDVAKSTHYHATYVRPYWIREMKRMVKHGQHIFYRPYRWGDGREEAGWGVASLTHTVKSRLAKN